MLFLAPPPFSHKRPLYIRKTARAFWGHVTTLINLSSPFLAFVSLSLSLFITFYKLPQRITASLSLFFTLLNAVSPTSEMWIKSGPPWPTRTSCSRVLNVTFSLSRGCCRRCRCLCQWRTRQSAGTGCLCRLSAPKGPRSRTRAAPRCSPTRR